MRMLEGANFAVNVTSRQVGADAGNLMPSQQLGLLCRIIMLTQHCRVSHQQQLSTSRRHAFSSHHHLLVPQSDW
jgi:hypothetical protein